MIQQSTPKQSRQFDPAWAWSIQLWLSFGLLFIAWVFFAMYMFPNQKPNDLAGDTSTVNFFERALLQKVLRYDVDWYVGIARDGYGPVSYTHLSRSMRSLSTYMASLGLRQGSNTRYHSGV